MANSCSISGGVFYKYQMSGALARAKVINVSEVQILVSPCLFEHIYFLFLPLEVQ